MNYNNNNQDVFEMILDTDRSNSASASASPSKITVSEDWHADHVEGQLALDVAETEDNIYVISTMAGATAEKIEVFIHNDLLTIRGNRNFPVTGEENMNFFHQECFWGNFSRTIVMPTDIKGDLARAEYKNGVLKIVVPKQSKGGRIPISIIED
ncbi:MAG: Hsp20 family protein [Candidatus Magasanikbacteria bacterium]|nr:Hsp20 family protein [Candidatus Magasanikbacteria bacterium]